MTFKRIEDIDAWQKARLLTGAVYRATREGEFARDFGLRDQMRRAAVSIMANIALIPHICRMLQKLINHLEES